MWFFSGNLSITHDFVVKKNNHNDAWLLRKANVAQGSFVFKGLYEIVKKNTKNCCTP